MMPGWIFGTDSYEGAPYIQCPYCQRKISGKKIIFADKTLIACPDCGKELHFGDIQEDDWLYMDSYFGEIE